MNGDRGALLCAAGSREERKAELRRISTVCQNRAKVILIGQQRPVSLDHGVVAEVVPYA
jgi:hypothetical protein